MTQTSNGRAQRKSLANEIDRLDGILDGLDEALAGSVETAVRDVVGQVVKEAVEATIKEVLSNPDLLRAVAAQHPSVATAVRQTQAQAPPRRTLQEWLKGKVAWLYQKAGEKVARTKRNLGSVWTWCVEEVKRGCSWAWARGKDAVAGCRHCLRLAWFGLRCAWRFRKTTAVALAVGSLVGVGAYLSGPEIAGALCGLGGAMMTAAGTILWPLSRLLFGGNNDA